MDPIDPSGIWDEPTGEPLPPPTPDSDFVASIRLPELLKTYRDRANLTQHDVDREFDIRQPLLSDWENGVRTPTERSLWRISLAYASKIPDAEPTAIFAHLKQARDNKPVLHQFDRDILILADRLQAHPERERRRLAVAMLAILKAVELLLRR